MPTFSMVIPILQRECRLLPKVPVLLDDRISVRSIKAEHIGAIISKRRGLADLINGRTKCILIDGHSEIIPIEILRNIALYGSFSLNLFAKSGSIMCTQAFVIQHIKSYSLIDTHDMASISPPNHEKFEIEQNTSPDEVKAIYMSALKAAEKDKSLSITVSRFNSSLTKTILEDKLIDMAICLESIFNAQTEISFRFSIYNSVLSEDDPHTRYEIFLLLKKMYSLRSDLVHGNKQIDISWFTDNWGRIVKIAKVSLVKKIDFLQHSSPKDWQVHLDKLTLGAKI